MATYILSHTNISAMGMSVGGSFTTEIPFGGMRQRQKKIHGNGTLVQMMSLI